MSSVVNYVYSKEGIEDIKGWAFGVNWPTVYIVYNDKKAYVGESLDAVRRTEQHLREDAFKDFTHICLISNKTFNKSVILDLEAFLIKYMSGDGGKKLINATTGIVDHNYFYKESYEDDFKEIWQKLIEIGIVTKSLVDIENSVLFEFSPFKSLNKEQLDATYDILNRLSRIDKKTDKTIVQVTGGAGTGKSILAVYLFKLLVDLRDNKEVWKSIDDDEESFFIQKISKNMSKLRNLGYVVPMETLRATMKEIFSTIDGLSEDMVLSPEQVVGDEMYDVLVVDEAHRLYKRKHLPNQHLFVKFDRINRQLMQDNFTKSENDYTELDWIIKASRMQVLFYDKYQNIRVADIEPERFSDICKPHILKYIELFSQMRCKGGNGYYDYVKLVLESKSLSQKEYKSFNNYEVKVINDVEDLFTIIREKNKENGLSKVLTGPGWAIKEQIVIEGHNYEWANVKNIKDNSIFSIHKIQGYDLEYAGVIFGKEVYYDEDNHCIAVNKKELKDNFTKSAGDEYMLRYILNIYLTLMTRGIKGTYLYAVDDKLREYLKEFF